MPLDRNMITHNDLKKLDGLIRIMDNSPVYSEEELKILWENDRINRKKIYEKMLESGQTYGQASGAPDFLNQPYEDFKLYLKATDNLLDKQIKIVEDAFNLYLKNGQTPAPYYAWRIAVILSKAKMKDKEKKFLSAWCRHFDLITSASGSTYGKLVKRAQKLDIKTKIGQL